MKKSVDLKALAYAIEDGRIDVWENTNGSFIVIQTVGKQAV